MVLLSVSASSSEGPPGSWGCPVNEDGGGGILRSKLPGNGGKIGMLPGGAGGMKVGVFRDGARRFWDGVLEGAVAVKGGRGEKNPGGGIPGGRAGRLMAPGAGGKGGAKLGDGRRGTGAIENGVLDDRGGMVCGRRAASVGVSSTKPTEPDRFFEELPP